MPSSALKLSHYHFARCVGLVDKDRDRHEGGLDPTAEANRGGAGMVPHAGADLTP